MIVIQNMNKDTHHLVDCTLEAYVSHMMLITNFEMKAFGRGPRIERWLELAADHGWMIQTYYPPITYELSECPVPDLD